MNQKGGEIGNSMRESNISLVIESYEEIFSSFDARAYESKSLSVDFINECKRAAIDKGNELELRIMVPKDKRNLKHEGVIKNRLKSHFQRHRDLLEKERKGIVHQGLYFVGFGMMFMAFAAYVLVHYPKQGFIKELLIVLLQPGGWFLFWEGLNLMIFESKKISPDLTFYRKMTNSTISFFNY